MDDNEVTKIDLDILEKLWRRHKVGRSYTPVQEAMSGIPRSKRGQAKNRVEVLVKEKLLLEHAKDGRCISINPRRRERVKDLLAQRLPRPVVEHLDQAPADDGYSSR